MENLKHIIGPAPSEMEFNDLLKALSSERDRVRRTVFWFRNNVVSSKPIRAKSSPKPKTQKLSTQLKAEGINQADFLAAIAAAKLRKENESNV